MKPVYSDEDLTAFLDGTIDADIAVRIDATAQADPALSRRIEELAIDTHALKNAFEPLLGLAQARNLAHKLDCANSREVANRPDRPSGLMKIARYTAAVVIGAALSWMFLSPKPDWRVEVAHYQALYVPDTLTVVAPNTARLQIEFARISEALDLALDPLAFADIERLQLRRAQVLGFEGAPLVQIAFTLPDGSPIAFCILQRSGEITTPKADFLVGLASASWSTETHRFLAIGGGNAAEILALAAQFQERI